MKSVLHFLLPLFVLALTTVPTANSQDVSDAELGVIFRYLLEFIRRAVLRPDPIIILPRITTTSTTSVTCPSRPTCNCPTCPCTCPSTSTTAGTTSVNVWTTGATPNTSYTSIDLMDQQGLCTGCTDFCRSAYNCGRGYCPGGQPNTCICQCCPVPIS